MSEDNRRENKPWKLKYQDKASNTNRAMKDNPLCPLKESEAERKQQAGASG